MPFTSSVGGKYGFEGVGGGGSLYPFTAFTFTSAGVTGQTGPTLTQLRTSYSSAPWAANEAFLNVTTQGIQRWTVPASGNYRIEAAGAKGGNGLVTGGFGALMIGTVSLTAASILQILVGQPGVNGTGVGGGGGGTFVVSSSNTPILIAGGGGGGENQTNSAGTANKPGTIATSGQAGVVYDGTTSGVGGTNGGGGGVSTQYGNSGAGGGGLNGNGLDAIQISSEYARGGSSFTNGGVGGNRAGSGSAGPGGFGGGGGADWYYWTGAGGGGGYSGGGGGAYYGAGGGGGSFAAGSSQANTSGANNGSGYVTITKL